MKPLLRPLATYDFGWDITPAVFRHDGTYSILLKDNHYPTGSYCGNPSACPPQAARYDITSLDSNLSVEWKFTSTNTLSCQRDEGGTVTCVSDHPEGFEWCINQPAVDSHGVASKAIRAYDRPGRHIRVRAEVGAATGYVGSHSSWTYARYTR